ncbi:hypothetical protein B0H13DRAFT_2324752 [Mycena leptocephala]|nr:hypothetical protein B0H13DRAFT_2324752 [Mycena leptocephala]
MAEHVRIHHAEYASPQQPEGLPLPYAVWENMRITQEEELAMGVKEFLIPREFTQVARAVTEAAAAMTSIAERAWFCPRLPPGPTANPPSAPPGSGLLHPATPSLLRPCYDAAIADISDVHVLLLVPFLPPHCPPSCPARGV